MYCKYKELKFFGKCEYYKRKCIDKTCTYMRDKKRKEKMQKTLKEKRLNR